MISTEFNFLEGTYYVPTTLFVLSSVWSPPNVLARPKSEIFGFMLLSSKILLILRSLWIILSLESWWRYRSPRAILATMFLHLGQSSNLLLVWSIKNRQELGLINRWNTYIAKMAKTWKDSYQKWRSLSFCWACSHRLTFSHLHECNSQEASQGFGAEV